MSDIIPNDKTVCFRPSGTPVVRTARSDSVGSRTGSAVSVAGGGPQGESKTGERPQQHAPTPDPVEQATFYSGECGCAVCDQPGPLSETTATVGPPHAAPPAHQGEEPVPVPLRGRDGLWVLAPDGQDGVHHHRLGRVDVTDLAVREPECLPLVSLVQRLEVVECLGRQGRQMPARCRNGGTARPPGRRVPMRPHRVSGADKRDPSRWRRTRPASAARAPDGRAQTDRPGAYVRGTASAARRLPGRSGRHNSDARRCEARRVRRHCRARSPGPVWPANPQATTCTAFSAHQETRGTSLTGNRRAGTACHAPNARPMPAP